MSDSISAILFTAVTPLALIVCYLFFLYRKSISEARLSKEQLIQAMTHLEHFQTQVKELEDNAAVNKEEKEQLLESCSRYEKEAGVTQEKIRSMESQMRDWEKTKEQILKDTKAAMFDSGSELFKQEAEKLEKKTQEGFQEMLKSLASLNQRLGHNEKLVNTVWSALSTPQAVGNFAEIGLENTLKNYGLVPGRDFIMQYSIKTQTTDLRPDAVVFLSADNVMVIDSKASKFFLESESDDEALRGEKLEQLKKSMNDHLKALSTKAYHESIKEYIKAGGKQSKVGHIYTIMFVHNESVLHKLLDVDPEFMQKAQTKDVVVSGPTGLAAAMSLARFDIVSQKQSENYARIVDEVGALLGSLETLLKHAERMGRGVTSVATSFQKFSASVNRSFLPKARKLVQLGVTLPKNKELPGQLPNVHVSTEESYVIEGEAVANQSEEDVALLNKDDQAG